MIWVAYTVHDKLLIPYNNRKSEATHLIIVSLALSKFDTDISVLVILQFCHLMNHEFNRRQGLIQLVDVKIRVAKKS